MLNSCEFNKLWEINPNFFGLCPCKGQVAYALLTRAPVVSDPKTLLPLDLHVLSLPLAFILSQDQTLHCIYKSLMSFVCFLSLSLPFIF